SDLRRPAGPLADATVIGALGAVVIGLAAGELDLVPTWPAHGWLLAPALTSQAPGWLLVSASPPRLPRPLSSVPLAGPPVGSVLLGVLIFSESPTGWQLVGVAAILTGLVVATRRRVSTV